SPAISIDQKTTSKNPRSTVGTVTEIYDYLRLLWARIGKPHCPKCGKEIEQQTVDQIVDALESYGVGTKLSILAPVIRGRKGEYQKIFDDAKKDGYVRVRVDGNMTELSEEIKLDKKKKHSIDIVVDRIVIKENVRERLTDSIETALKLTGGLVTAAFSDGEERLFSQNYACPDCGISIDELAPRLFSFNNPFGACPECGGLGVKLEITPESIIPNPKLSLNQGAVKASGFMGFGPDSMARLYFSAVAEHYGFSMDTPVCDLKPEHLNKILYGTNGEKIKVRWEHGKSFGVYEQIYSGVIPNLYRRYQESTSDYIKTEIQSCMTEIPCSRCKGNRLNDNALAVTVGGINIIEFCKMSVDDELSFIKTLDLSNREHLIGDRIIKEISARLEFLKNVGLEYLSMSRASSTLSGGESQRIRLATQIGSSLMGVLYVLDEPSIGLHQRDNQKLIDSLKKLRDAGNTLIIVEHDEETMRSADCIVDVGPGAGVHGGNIVASGTVG
ncbi:MAG: excinuclease ABC subunit UvrA, partial [Clostridia bacterium]|nr:excinuclease ABC subunit UvrA [Clostridia bacterium]